MRSQNIVKIASFVLMLAAGAFGGCAEMGAAHVKVLTAAPTVPYETLGKVAYLQSNAVGFKESALDRDPIDGLREKAAALGADAVIVVVNKRVPLVWEHQGRSGARTEQVVEGIAIRYKKAGGE